MLAQNAEPDCLDTERLCRWTWELTEQRWLAEASALIIVPLRILLILALALLARWLLRRAIDRLVRRTSADDLPTILRPLPEKVRSTVREAAGVRPARRRQRADAIGSVLRGAVTIAVFSVAALLILGEFNINLAPLLAGAGIAGVALGFGAQTLVRDLLAGLFILMEDQYGVGDSVDLGEARGVVETVGLRITTLRDMHGVYWYVPNGEIRRVGNSSQGTAVVVVDTPIGFAPVTEAVQALQVATQRIAEDPAFRHDLVEQPEVLGVETVTVEGAVVRTVAKTSPNAQGRIARELRRRQTEALEEAGLAAQILAARLYQREPGGQLGQP
ncbi:MAG TPA: mechanosensitive ion channel family protein [Natronosporangium sp.]